MVIAIIAILASMLMPALSSAIDTANNINCMNGMKQSGLAMTLYTNDYKGNFPQANSPHYSKADDVRKFLLPPYYGASSNVNGNLWTTEEMDTWYRSSKIFCSEAYDLAPTVLDFGSGIAFFGTHAFNGSIRRYTDAIFSRVQNVNNIANPSEYGMMFDAASRTNDAPNPPPHESPDLYSWSTQATGDQYYENPSLLHFRDNSTWLFIRSDQKRGYGYYANGTSNVVRADQSAKSMSFFDYNFGYDGTEHSHYNITTKTFTHSQTDSHETGKGLGDKNNRTYSSLKFWTGY